MSARSNRSFNRDINRGKGSFTSASARSSSPAARSARGGPGENDYSHMYSCGNSSTQVTSSFRSSVPLGGHVRRSNTPGVGEYDPTPVLRKSPSKEGSSSMFAGAQNSRSVSSSSSTREHVGPGEDYDDDYRSKDELSFWQRNDPIIITAKMLTSTEREAIDANVETIIADAIVFAENSPWPEPKELFSHVYAD